MESGLLLERAQTLAQTCLVGLASRLHESTITRGACVCEGGRAVCLKKSLANTR